MRTMKQLRRFLLLCSFTCVAFFSKAQTNDLLFNLGASGGTVNVTSVATDASNNIFICGSYKGVSINFNPLGVDSLKTSQSTGGRTSGFIAKYNSSGLLQKFIRIGFSSGNNNETGIKVVVDPFTNDVYFLSKIVSFQNFDNTGSAVFLQGGGGATAVVKYDNNLVAKMGISIGSTNGSSPYTITGGTGEEVVDVIIDNSSFYIIANIGGSNVIFNQKNTASPQLVSTTGGKDIVIAKYDKTTFQTSNVYQIGSTFDDEAGAIKADLSGNIYITGLFRGNGVDFSPASGSVGDNTLSEFGSPGSGDVFVVKYNSSFAHQWSFNIGTALDDKGMDLAVNPLTGGVFVGGYIKSDGANQVDFDPSAGNALTTTLGNFDGFIAAYTTSGVYSWHKMVAQSGDDKVLSVALDASGNPIVCGYVSGTSINLGNSITVSSAGSTDPVVVQYTSTGTTTTGFTVGGSAAEQANSIIVSPSGKVHVGGFMAGTGDYDPTAGTANLTLKGTQDGWLARYVLCTPPTISAQPGAVNICQGTTASFSVTASNATGYQWTLGGSDISNATNSTYSITGATPSNNGTYAVRVSNACSNVTSNNVVLTVTPTVNPGIVGASQTICSGSSPAALAELTAASGGTTTFTYQWQSSPDGATWSNVASATSSTYSPGSLTVTTHYRRLVSSGNCTNIASNAVIITVTPATTAGSVGSAQTICSGSIPSAFTQLTAVTGGTGSYTYQWQSSLNNTTFTDISSATGSTYTSIALSTSTYFRRVVSSGGCTNIPSTSFLVTVTPTLTAGTIGTAQTICSGSAPATFTQTVAPTGGNGTNTYQWQSSPNGTTWTDIPSATNTTYTSGVLTSTTHFRREVSSGACLDVASNAIIVTVTPTTTPGAIAGDETVCTGSSVSAITVNTAPAGGTGSYTYTWEQSTNGGSSYTAIAGVTSATYTPTSVTSTTLYRRYTSSGGCTALVSNVITKTITPVVNAGSIGSNQGICQGATAASLTQITAASGGTGSFTYTWEQSINGGSSYTTISGATSTTYAPGAITTTTLYRRIASSGACSATTASVTITVTPTLSAGAIAGTETMCAGSTVSTLTSNNDASGGNGVYNYQWQSSLDGSSWGNIGGATSTTYAPGTLTVTTHYRRLVTSGNCSNLASNTVIKTITTALDPGSIGANQSICEGTAATTLTQVTAASGGTGSFTYSWQQSTNGGSTYTTVPSATSTTYAPGAIATTTLFRRIVTSGACNSPTASVTITVTPALSAGAIAGTESICSGTTASVLTNNNTASGGNGTITYKWESSPNGTTWTVIPSATGLTYSPGAITSTTHYRRLATSQNCVDVASNVIIKTVTPALTTGSIGSNQSLCEGTAAATLTELTAASGGNGTITYTWEQSTNGGSSYTTIPSATSTTYSPGAITTTTLYRRVATSGACVSSTTSVTVSVSPALVAGTIAGAETICSGTTSSAITSSVSASGGNGTITYKWQSSPNGSAWSDISGATTTTYSPGTLTSTTHYRRLATSQNCIDLASNVIIKTVTPALVAGTIGSNQTICSNVAPATITSTATPTGGTGSYTYTWESSPNGTTWTTVSGATSATYTSPILSSTTQFRRVVSSGACVNQATSPIIITVNPVVTPTVTVSASQTTVCSSVTVNFTSTITNGGTTPTYQWLLNGNTIPSATNSTFSASSFANNDKYSLRLTSNATCATATTVTSSDVTMTVTTSVVPSVTVTASASTICQGQSVNFTANPTNGGTAPTYKWKLNGNDIPSATNSTYATTSLQSSDVITVELTSNASCVSAPGTALSSGVSVTVNSNVTPTIVVNASSTSVCGTATVNFSMTTTNTGTGATYKWKKNTIDIPGATALTYSVGSITDGDQFTVEMTSTATCASPATVTATPVTINVTTPATPSVSLAASATTICTGTSVTFTATPTSGGSPTYQWKINGNNQGSATATNTFSSTTLDDGDVVSVVMTTSLTCITATNANSNQIPMAVNDIITPTISMSANQTSVCTGGSVIFTTSITGGGASPTYKWYKNSIVIPSATGSTYEATGIANNDAFYAELTSNATCKTVTTVTSSSISISLVSSTAAGVTLSVNPGTTAYDGQSVVFTATPSSGGSTPTYEWKKNSNVIGGATSSVYTTNVLSTGDVITVTMTSSLSCATGSPASASVTMTIQNNPPFGTVITGPSSVTSGEQNVTFTVPNQPDMDYVWTVPPGATIISGQGTNSIVVDFGNSGGTVSVTETNPAGTSNVINLPVGITTPVKLKTETFVIRIYPIPVADDIHIDIEGEGSATVTVYSTSGEYLGKFIIDDISNVFTAPFVYASGVYLLRIEANDTVVYKKITKE